MIYFDNAATSRFKPNSSLKTLYRFSKASLNSGRGAHKDAVKMTVAVEKTRSLLLDKLDGSDTHELIFTKNCTEALNLAIFGALKRGDHVITSVLEHNSVLRPLYKLKKDKIISLTTVNPDKDGRINPEHIERLITEKTRLIVINYVSNVTGCASNIAYIAAVAKKHGVWICVDGAQALPNLPISLRANNITFLAAAGHKGFHSPQGVGFLAFDKSVLLKPLIYGGTGTSSDSVYQPTSYPDSLESGTLNAPAIAALGKSAAWTYKHLDRINKITARLAAALLYGLKNIPSVSVYTPDGVLSGVVSFNVGELTSSEVGDLLNDRYHIAVRTGIHCAPLIHNHLGTLERGAVRASVGYNNTLWQIKKLVKAVEGIAQHE